MKITFPDGTVVEGTKKELEDLIRDKVSAPHAIPPIVTNPLVFPWHVEPMPVMPPVMPTPEPGTSFPRDWSGAPIVTCESGGGDA